MNHFTDEAWLDFARRLLPADEMSRMRAHLDTGCARCGKLYSLWEEVSHIAGRESDYEPHESVVNAVKRAYSGRTWRPVSRLENRAAMLVFDSFLTAGATAGIRSISSAARHLLYRSGPLTIDVRLDDAGATKMMIAGQVLENAEDVVSPGRGEVTLMRGDTTLARTPTNEFGEFQFEIDREPGVRIRIEVGGQQTVILTLPD